MLARRGAFDRRQIIGPKIIGTHRTKLIGLSARLSQSRDGAGQSFCGPLLAKSPEVEIPLAKATRRDELKSRI